MIPENRFTDVIDIENIAQRLDHVASMTDVANRSIDHPIKKGTCADCRFYYRESDIGGECRLNPPNPERLNHWPDVFSDKWCGKGQWSDELMKKLRINSISNVPRFR